MPAANRGHGIPAVGRTALPGFDRFGASTLPMSALDRPRLLLGPTLGERVRGLRRRQDITQSRLAAAAGLNQGYLSAIERNQRQPSPKVVRTLAAALGVPEGVLIGPGEGHDGPQALETREVPLFGAIPNGPPSDGQEPPDVFPVLRHVWRPDRYCLRCEFDSMEPTLKRGDIILVDYRPGVDPEFVQGRVCACLIDGRPTLKRVSVETRQGRRLVILRGDNPSSPPSVVDETADFSIQGVAVSLVSREL